MSRIISGIPFFIRYHNKTGIKDNKRSEKNKSKLTTTKKSWKWNNYKNKTSNQNKIVCVCSIKGLDTHFVAELIIAGKSEFWDRSFSFSFSLSLSFSLSSAGVDAFDFVSNSLFPLVSAVSSLVSTFSSFSTSFSGDFDFSFFSLSGSLSFLSLRSLSLSLSRERSRLERELRWRDRERERRELRCRDRDLERTVFYLLKVTHSMQLGMQTVKNITQQTKHTLLLKYSWLWQAMVIYPSASYPVACMGLNIPRTSTAVAWYKSHLA